MSRRDNLGIESGSETEDRTGVLCSANLILIQKGSSTQQDFGKSFGNASNGFLRRSGSKGDFHDIKSACKEGLSKGLGGFYVVKNDNGNNAFGEDAINHESDLRVYFGGERIVR
jgi:hypothetical protein